MHDVQNLVETYRPWTCHAGISKQKGRDASYLAADILQAPRTEKDKDQLTVHVMQLFGWRLIQPAAGIELQGLGIVVWQQMDEKLRDLNGGACTHVYH